MREQSFGCYASQTDTTSCNSSSDLKWLPCWATFRGQKRRKLLSAKSEEYCGWGLHLQF